MKKLSKYIFILLATIFFNNLSAQERNVIWVHGLDGSESSWAYYESIFSEEREINSHRETYNTSVGIDHTANQVIGTIDNDLGAQATHPRNIAIGHSMGGLTIRDIDRLTGNNKRFGGLITVASPHYGAPIANSILDGSLESAAENACEKISAGPIAEYITLPWNFAGNMNNDILCNYFIDNESVQDIQGNSSVNSDLRVGSSTINAINSHNTTTPTICIYAEEETPVHWRMFSSEVSDNENDNEIVSDVNTAKNIWKAYRDYNIGKAIANSWNPWAAALYHNRARQWKKGMDWIDDSENIWCTLIKTSRTESYTHSYWDYQCVYDDWNPYPEYPERPIAPPHECEWKWVYVTETSYVTVNYPSDGLLPEYTQKLNNLPGGNYYHVSGANHLEVRDMSNSPQGDLTEIEFNKIWNRPSLDFFHTEER